MSTISTHVLDTVHGKPASGIAVTLEAKVSGKWRQIASGTTDSDGRCRNLTGTAAPGLYRISFHTGPYFEEMKRKSIYPEIQLIFACDGEAHYHLPLLLSDNSYTTYRGS